MKVEQEAFERDQVSESTNQTKKEMKRKENAAKKQRKELQEKIRRSQEQLEAERNKTISLDTYNKVCALNNKGSKS